MTAFCVKHSSYPVMQFKALKQPSSLQSKNKADTFAAGLEVTHKTLDKDLQDAEACQTQYPSYKQVVSKVGDVVSL